MTDNFDVQITKRKTLAKPRNEWVAQDWFLYYGRIYDKTHTYYRPFKFVVCIDLACDLWDGENDIPYDEALESIVFSFTDLIRGFEQTGAFYAACNDSIERWNRSHR